MRQSKSPEERKLEIIHTAMSLFSKKGFDHTSVEDITKAMNVAKGTFYYYFKSKNQVVDAIIDHTLVGINKRANQLINLNVSSIKKLELLIGGALNSDITDKVRDGLHQPKNRSLHEQMNVKTIKLLTPYISSIVEQGISEGVMEVSHIEDTVGFTLTGIQFYLDELLFTWSDEELCIKQTHMIDFIERAFLIKKGTLFKEE